MFLSLKIRQLKREKMRFVMFLRRKNEENVAALFPLNHQWRLMRNF